MTSDYNQLEARVAHNGQARSAADAVWDLIREEGDRLPESAAPVFYKRLRERMNEILGPELQQVDARPLNAVERRQFELETLRFGKYAGRTVRQVLEADAGYLLWLADEPFGRMFRRYLSTPGMVQQLNELAEEQSGR